MASAYQPRIRPRVAQAAPAAPADLSIARGVADLGGGAMAMASDRREVEEARKASEYRIAQEQQRRDRSALIADRAGALADAQGRVAARLDEARNKAAAGAPGWTDSATEIVDKEMSAFIETLGDDPEVVERFTPLIANWGRSTLDRERGWGNARKAEHERNGLKNWHEQRSLAAQRAGDLQSAFDEWDVLLDGTDMDATDKEALRLAGKQSFTADVLQAQVDGGRTAQVREMISSGKLDPWLTTDSRDRLLTDADRTDERARIAAEREQADAERTARETLKGVQALLDSGAEPTAAQMRTAEQAVALLPPEQKVEFAAMQVQLGVNRDTRGMDAAGIRHQRDFLRAKVDSGKATQGEQMTLAALDRRLNGQEDREADDLRVVLGEGTAGRIAAVEQRQGQDAATRFSVLEKAEPGLGHVAMLPTAAARRLAIEGKQIRKAQADLVPEKEAKAAFRQNVGSVAAMVGEQYDDKLDIAMDLYAHHVSRSPQKGFNADLFWQYTNMAFGATKRGDGTWQGGLGTINGARVVLPDRVSQAELARAMARTDWSAARDRNGQPVPKAFITGRMYPSMVEENDSQTIYQMRDLSGNVLLAPNGAPLRFRVANGVGR